MYVLASPASGLGTVTLIALRALEPSASATGNFAAPCAPAPPRTGTIGNTPPSPATVMGSSEKKSLCSVGRYCDEYRSPCWSTHWKSGTSMGVGGVSPLYFTYRSIQSSVSLTRTRVCLVWSTGSRHWPCPPQYQIIFTGTPAFAA